MSVQNVSMYPTAKEAIVVELAEELMIDTMKRYDPSHDAYHGKFIVYFML